MGGFGLERRTRLHRSPVACGSESEAMEDLAIVSKCRMRSPRGGTTSLPQETRHTPTLGHHDFGLGGSWAGPRATKGWGGWMETKRDAHAMLAVALQQARKSLTEGGIPIGAAIFDAEVASSVP